MKNFEESLRHLNAPDPPDAAFRHKLRHDLSAAGAELSLRRWRRACIASGGLATVLLITLAGFVAVPSMPEALGARLGGESRAVSTNLDTWLADNEIAVENDRGFLEAYHARQGRDVRVRSVDDERLVAIREFTMSDGQQMMVYTELGEGQSTRSATPVNDRLAQLTSGPVTTF